jgi:biotin carboxylase
MSAARRLSAPRWLALLESNTTGTGREFCAAARARGLRPVLLTRDPDRYQYVREDDIDIRRFDTADPAAIIEACAALQNGGGLAGVTSSSEYFVSAAARAAASFGLPAPDADAIARCRAKDQQRAILAAGGVPVPPYAVAEDVTQALLAAESIGWPVVLKPVSGSGSVGVRLCRDLPETRAWAGELFAKARDERGNARPGRILVEAAVTGPEFSVETFDGSVVAVVRKHLGPEPYFVEIGHDVPASAADETIAALADTTVRALTALNLLWGAAHTEVRLSSAGPVIIEVNPRLAGGMIPVAIRAAAGVDLVDAVVARAAGQARAAVAPGAGHAAIRFLRAQRDGRVAAVEGLDAAARAQGVVAATTSTAVGRVLHITHSFQDRVACVVATGGTADQAAECAMAAMRLVRIRLDGTSTATHPQIPGATHKQEEGVGDDE